MTVNYINGKEPIAAAKDKFRILQNGSAIGQVRSITFQDLPNMNKQQKNSFAGLSL